MKHYLGFFKNYYGWVLGIAMAVLVMLPRSLQIVMHIQICQKYFAQWKNLKEKLSVAEESLIEPSPVDLVPFISIDKIKMNNNPVKISDLTGLIKELDSGRITISGENGTGKSNLMLTLKESLGTLAVYLPAHHQFILQESRLKLSSGEAALYALQDTQKDSCKIILLDEWDANLSRENRSAMSKMLDEVSLQKVVVEVRHHQ